MRKPPSSGLAALPTPPAPRRGGPLALGLGVLTLLAARPVAWAGEGVEDAVAPVEAPAESEASADSASTAEPEGPAAPEPATAAPEADVEAGSDAASADGGPRPPRVDGPYFGGVVSGAGAFARVNDLETPSPFSGFLVDLRAGDVVLPWLSIGIQVLGGAGWVSDQRIAHGGLLMDFGFYPIKRVPFSLRTGFGFGAGAVNDDDEDRRFGFGGALFKAGARYAWFPGAAKRRPRRGGGFALGPEFNWVGYTPTGPGAPMNNVLTLGLYTGFYFGD